MSEKILFVDDEPNLLDGIRRQLRQQFDIETATGGAAGLQTISDCGPFAVVVSDMRMPGMNGPAFLAHARKADTDSVQMILSGQADLESTIEAVNEGRIFRFLTKPCSAETLTAGVNAALEQHRLIIAERELLEKTLHSAVEVLTEVLGLVSSLAHSRASRVQQYAEQIAAHLGVEDRWQIRIAAMLAQIGCVSLPGDTLGRLATGEELSEAEQRMVDSHPEVAGRLLAGIPRLEDVAEMVANQTRQPDMDTLPGRLDDWDLPVVGSQILRAAAEFDALVIGGTAPREAAACLGDSSRGFPPAIIAAVENIRVAEVETEPRALSVADLRISMVLDQDVCSQTGLRLMQKGQPVTQTILVRLRSFAEGVGVVQPIRALVPHDLLPTCSVKSKH